MKRTFAWPLAVPIVLVGLLAGHWLASRLAVPDGRARAQELAATGHGYSVHLPLVLGICIAMLVVAFGLRVLGAFRGGTADSRLPRAFAVLPPLAYLLRELLEQAVQRHELFAAPVL